MSTNSASNISHEGLYKHQKENEKIHRLAQRMPDIE